MGVEHEPVRAAESIRPATLGDQSILEALRASVGWSTVETGLASMARGRSEIFILEVNKTPAASGALVTKHEDEDLANGLDRSLVSNLIVDPAFQHHGLGTRLLHYLESQAVARGLRYMTIGVDASNVRARNLYEREGYHALKDKTEAWGPVHYLIKELARSRDV